MLRERCFVQPLSLRDQVTATEVINGILCRVVLRQDRFGCFREVSVSPIDPTGQPRRAITAATLRGACSWREAQFHAGLEC